MSSLSTSSVLPLPSLFLLLLLPLVISGFVVSSNHQYPLSQQLQQQQQQLHQQQQLQARIAIAKSRKHDIEGKTAKRRQEPPSDPVSRCDTKGEIQRDHEWDESYQQLKAVYNRHEPSRLHPTTTTTTCTTTTNKDLFEWCKIQAHLASTGRLTQVRLSRLVEIGFWNDELPAQPWDHWYSQLMDFYLQHGHSNVHCTSETYLLAQWGQLQRTSALLSIRQKRLLWSINFVFDAEQAEFETQYQRLLELETKEPILSVRQWKKLQRSYSKPDNAVMTAASSTTSDAFVSDTLWKLGAAHEECNNMSKVVIQDCIGPPHLSSIATSRIL
ncbi:hypothetical protein MHU86_1513 [Fragilaria crotonensis]|nr:hypothetical protein MHU86_1513 [Fragilaria crotonensis]